MKRCPKCSSNYSDDTLEYCFEDGSQLIRSNDSQAETPTITVPRKSNFITDKTENLPFPTPAGNLNFSGADNPPQATSKDLLKEKVVEQSNKVLEIAPLVIALAQN